MLVNGRETARRAIDPPFFSKERAARKHPGTKTLGVTFALFIFFFVFALFRARSQVGPTLGVMHKGRGEGGRRQRVRLGSRQKVDEF